MDKKEKRCLIFVLMIFGSFIFIVSWYSRKGVQLVEPDIAPYIREGMLVPRHKFNKTPQHTERNAFYRINTTPEKTVKLPFLANYKNPCWQEMSGNTSRTRMRIRCLPYFYLVGAPKSGTTDLHDRLVQHPLISSRVMKEPHWLTRKRFYNDKSQNLSAYLRIFDRAVQDDITQIQQNGYFKSIFGDCSASTLWDNKLLLAGKSGNMTLTPYTNADVIYNLNPKTKIIIILRNPITRLYSGYLYFKRGRKSAEEFHNKVVPAVDSHEKCLTSHSERHCAYIEPHQLRIQIGLYYLYIEDYMRVFPREQIKIIKLEDYSKNISTSITDVFNFLGAEIPPDEELLRIANLGKANSNTKSQTTGQMLPKTFNMLYKFYKPYNDRLVKLLGNKFNYN